MRARRIGATAAVLVTALAAGACSGPAAVEAPAPDPPPTTSMADLEAAYWARIEGARSAYTEADVLFMTGMIGHHAQALIMAAMAPTHDASPAVRRLAARIDNAQRDEIATMQRWLRDRGESVPEVHIQGTTLMIHGPGGHDAGDHHAHMPGMLTQAQLDELDAARGPEFDRLFLTYMIQHHGGAVVMVDSLFATDGAAQDDEAFKFASDVQVDQRTEVARMQQMLDALADVEQGP